MSTTESTKPDTLDAVFLVEIKFLEINHKCQFVAPKAFYVPRTSTVGQFKEVLAAYLCKSGQTKYVFLHLVRDEMIDTVYNDDGMTMSEVCEPLGDFPNLVAEYVGPVTI